MFRPVLIAVVVLTAAAGICLAVDCDNDGKCFLQSEERTLEEVNREDGDCGKDLV
jgi:hypothetical protein